MTLKLIDCSRTIGFIGLGAMGSHMFNFVIYDINPRAVHSALDRHKFESASVRIESASGVVGAKNGTLTIMVGGSAEAFTRSRPYLQPLSASITHCGDLGAGLAAKSANNMLLGIHMLGLSEAILLGTNLGLEPQVLADIIDRSTGRSWSSEINHPVPEVTVGNTEPPAHRGYEGGFVTKLAHKDLALCRGCTSVKHQLGFGKADGRNLPTLCITRLEDCRP